MATKPKPKSVRPKVRAEQPGTKPMPNPHRGPIEGSTQGVVTLQGGGIGSEGGQSFGGGQSSGGGATGSWPDGEGMRKYLDSIKKKKGTMT